MCEQGAFFYGTLMAPQVLYRVLWQDSNPPQYLRDQLEMRPAMLHSFCRHQVLGVDYPGISPQKGKSVLGVYVTGLNESHMRNLDCFEGDQYVRCKVQVTLLEGVEIMESGGTAGKEVEAETYVFIDQENVIDGEWNFQEFVRDQMRRWVDSSDEFKEVDAIAEDGHNPRGGGGIHRDKDMLLSGAENLSKCAGGDHESKRAYRSQ